MALRRFSVAVTLKKEVMIAEDTTPHKARLFRSWDAALFCIGAMMGSGIHVMTGRAILDFNYMVLFNHVVVGLTVLMTGMCYSELSCLYPDTRAHYQYTYYTMGELSAFLIGWSTILAFSIGCVVNGVLFTDFISHNFKYWKIHRYMHHNLDLTTSCYLPMSSKINFICPFVILIAGVSTAFVRPLKYFVNVVVLINILSIVSLITIYPFMEFNNIDNLASDRQLFNNFWSGIVYSYYCYLGYESLLCIGEELVKPRETKPTILLISIKIVIFLYFSLIFLHLFANPTNDQDENSPFRYAVQKLGTIVLDWCFVFFGVCAIIMSCFAAMVTAMRTCFSLSMDGLFFRLFCRPDRYTKHMVIPGVLLGFLFGMIGMVADVDFLISLTILSSLIPKVMASLCLLITRYRCEREFPPEDKEDRWVLINYPNSHKEPTEITHFISMVILFNTVLSLIVLTLTFTIMLHYAAETLILKIIAIISTLSVFSFSILLKTQPINERKNLRYHVEDVPYQPLAAISMDIYMMFQVGIFCWVYLLIWFVIGILFYVFYGFHNSSVGQLLKPEAHSSTGYSGANENIFSQSRVSTVGTIRHIIGKNGIFFGRKTSNEI